MANFNTEDYAALKIGSTDIGEIKNSSGVSVWRATYSSIELYEGTNSDIMLPVPTLTISGGSYSFGDYVNLFHTSDGTYCISHMPNYSNIETFSAIFYNNNYSQKSLDTTVENTTGLFDYYLPYNSSVDDSFHLIDKTDVNLSTSSPFIAKLSKTSKSLERPKVKVKSGYPTISTASSSSYQLKIQLVNRTQGGYKLTITSNAETNDILDYYPVFIQYTQNYSSALIAKTIIVEANSTVSIDITDSKTLSSSYPVYIRRINSSTSSNDTYENVTSFTSVGTRYFYASWYVPSTRASVSNFKLTTSNRIVSTNNGVANSCSYAFIFFKIQDINRFRGIKFFINQSSEKNFDFGLISVLDSPLKPTSAVDTINILDNLKGKDGDITKEYIISDSNIHFITIKYRKDGSGNTGSDALQISSINYLELFDFHLARDIAGKTAILTIENHAKEEVEVNLNYFAFDGSSNSNGCIYGQYDINGVNVFNIAAGKTINITLADGDATFAIDQYYVECYIEGNDVYGTYYYAMF